MTEVNPEFKPTSSQIKVSHSKHIVLTLKKILHRAKYHCVKRHRGQKHTHTSLSPNDFTPARGRATNSVCLSSSMTGIASGHFPGEDASVSVCVIYHTAHLLAAARTRPGHISATWLQHYYNAHTAVLNVSFTSQVAGTWIPFFNLLIFYLFLTSLSNLSTANVQETTLIKYYSEHGHSCAVKDSRSLLIK